MGTRLLFTVSVLVLISNSTPCRGQSPTRVGQILVRFLYGDQWSYGQYCNDTRNVKTILEDDLRTQALYNGTFRGSQEEAAAIGAKARTSLSLLCSVGNWGYANQLLADLSNRPQENDSQCEHELEQLGEFMESGQFRWTGAGSLVDTNLSSQHWQQFNSFGRLASGPGRTNDLLLGDYDGCVQHASLRYCLGAYDKRTSKPGRAPPFKIGLCLPRSCSPRILRKSHRLMQILTTVVRNNLPETLAESSPEYELRDVHCEPHKGSNFWHLPQDGLGRALTKHLPIFWLLMLIIATVSGRRRKKAIGLRSSQCWRDLVEPFDLCANWHSFYNSAHPNSRLAGLNGAKVVCMNWLFLSHIMVFMSPYVADLGQMRLNSYHGALISQGQFGVPVFFMISGLLVGLKQMGQDKSPSFWEMIVSRYLRLAPMYLVVYAYVKTFSHLTGDGPLWDHGVSVQSEARQCMQESWLVPFLMLANFTPPAAHCLLTDWHVANDFQIYLLLPSLFWLYRRSRVAARWTIGITFLASHASHVLLWASNETFSYLTLAYESYLVGPRVLLDRLALDYVNPLGRIGTYFMGVLVADLLLAEWSKRLPAKSLNTSSGQSVGYKEWLKLVQERSGVSKSIELSTLAGQLKQQQQQGRAKAENDQAAASREAAHSSSPTAANWSASADKPPLAGAQEESFACLSRASERRQDWTRDRRDNMISSFKDTMLLLFGMLAAYGSLFALIWPPRMKLMFEPYSKAIAYPWVRLNAELGWPVCLYYLLRDNCRRGGRIGQKLRSVERRARETGASGRPAGSTEGSEPGDRNNNHHHQQADGQRASGERQIKNSHSAAPDAGATTRQATTRRASGGSGAFSIDFGGSLLKLRLWNVLVKLNYSLMLLHYSVIRYILQSQRRLLVFSWMDFFQLTTFMILLAYLLSLIVHLTIEMPLMALSKLLISRINQR